MTIEQIKNIEIHFVVSTARTGSTLLSSMFNMHENLLSPVEEPFAFNLYFKYHSIINWTSKIIDDYCYDFYLFSEGVLETQFGSRNELKQLLEKHKNYLDYDTVVKITYLCFFPERNKENITVIIDKQLRFHEFIEQVSRFFPKSKFIILTRDPRDNALVKMKRIIREGSHKNSFDRKNNYYHLALDWNREYTLLYKKRDVIGKDRFVELRYEDLVENPEQELLRIASFLGFKYIPQMLQYHEVLKDSMQKNVDLRSEAKKHFFELHKSLTEKVNTQKVNFWK
ncbi:MAG: sulfotransferase, partial [Bacteroidia bacterium]|nr:sulfotransferase [Bacteroidia bacterium]